MDRAKLIRIAMIERRQCYFAPGYIAPDECSELVDWAHEMRPHLKNRFGLTGRYGRRVAKLPHVSPRYTPLRLRIQREFGLGDDAQPEPNFGWFIGVGEPGSAIGKHVDQSPEGMKVLRCNLFLQVPTMGGLPVIDGARFEVEPGTLIGFLPSEVEHWSQRVEGSESRIILSFGYLVPADYQLPQSPHT